jgi:hypothetical protein
VPTVTTRYETGQMVDRNRQILDGNDGSQYSDDGQDNHDYPFHELKL